MIVWIIGLPGAGKTSVGREVLSRLKARNAATMLLDGDSLREVMDNDLGHSVEDRRRNGWRMCRLGAYLDRQGIDVVCCILSMFAEHQEWNRAHVSRYFEVFLDVDRATLEKRDQKGLYSGARGGRTRDVPGIDIPFSSPKNPDLVIANSETLQDLGPLASRIVAEIDAKWTGHVPL